MCGIIYFCRSHYNIKGKKEENVMCRFKKLTSLLLATAMVFGLAGCGGDSKGTTTETGTEVVETTEGATEDATTEEEIDLEAMGNLIENGDMSSGTDQWATYLNGGGCNVTVNKDEEIQIDIFNPGKVAHGVQIYHDGFDLKYGAVYEIQFDVHSTIERDLEWRIQINGGDYHAYATDTVTSTTELQHITAQFTMDEASDPAPRLCFNLGYTNSMVEAGIDVASLGEHSVMIDNVSLELIDASGVQDDTVTIEIPKVKVNQVGYSKDVEKVAVFSDLAEEDTTFTVVNVDSGEVAFEGTITEPVKNLTAGEMNSTGDFSELTEAGTYKVVTSGGEESYEFTIGDDVYGDGFKDVVRMLYLQRCGCELTSDLAGDFAHPICHTTEATIYGTTQKVEVSGGWHDAGDYGRYVSPAAKTVADLLLAYEKNPEAFGDACNIPESGDGINDALQEAKYELDWMLKMQDSATGGVYHKVTCKVFPETVMPQDETDELILSPISKTATADFAAAMALAGRIYAESGVEEYAAFSTACIEAAKKAWTYSLEHIDDRGFQNPADIVTGEYADGNSKDEYFWAGMELYKTTGDTSYIEGAKGVYEKVESYGGLGWMDVAAYGSYAALTNEKLKTDDAAFYSEIEKNFFATVDAAIETSKTNAYMVNKGEDYEWGSNLSAANTGMLLYMANDIKPNDEYVTYANHHLNYLYGVNATGYCFVTGVGTLYPEHPHHRPSEFTGKCIPGMLVGGPNSALEDPYAQAVFKESAAAKCYADCAQSYSVNEVTIYWNSPLIYLLAASQK